MASLLESGDRCAAAEEAARLEQDVIAASQTDAVPDLYLEDLGSVTHELVALIPACEPPPEDDEGEDGKGKDEGEDGKDKKKDKDKNKGKDKDDE